MAPVTRLNRLVPPEGAGAGAGSELRATGSAKRPRVLAGRVGRPEGPRSVGAAEGAGAEGGGAAGIIAGARPWGAAWLAGLHWAGVEGVT